MGRISHILEVKVDFSREHLLFPSIIEWVLVVLALAIVVTHAPRWVAAYRSASIGERIRGWKVDTRRLIGCLILTPVYFAAMQPVGSLAENTGVGFLITSCVYVFALSWLFVRDNNRRKTIAMTLNALITPTLVWFVFARIFRITLP
jgi:putative tricarboxylic transport membrane protein